MTKMLIKGPLWLMAIGLILIILVSEIKRVILSKFGKGSINYEKYV